MLSRTHLTFLLLGLAFFALTLSLYKGSTPISFEQLLFNHNEQVESIFFQLRLPRTFTAFICGGLLALAGSLMQLLLQNPLADPYALGLSGGAACFTLLMMMLGLSAEWHLLGAWAGSLLTILLIFMLGKKHAWQSHRLLLSGIALACGFSAGISAILVLSKDTSLHSMLFWLTGDLNGASFSWLGLIVLITSLTLCMWFAPGLDLLGRGEQEARVLGLSTRPYRMMLYLLSSLMTAVAVTIAGCIGFVGLIVPHLARSLMGYQHRLALPAAVLLGGSLLTIADTIARTAFAPEQLPVGILVALFGVPTFIWLLHR